MSCRSGCILVANLRLQDESFQLGALSGLPFAVAQFARSVCPFASCVCCLVMCSIVIFECKLDEASPECNSLLVSFCFSLLGRGSIPR